ncbi:ubiquilin-1-like [Uloborus diversus]|uniref:ubiquilin-1-like n=1 Tax=Uloborus diversus TaxID=327109 RepID=UPI00240A9C0B|nr:ubiquilin-1-like [Uloborus diversus]
MAEEVMNNGKRAILTKVKEEPLSDDDEVICEPVAKSPKRSDNLSLSECVVKTEPRDEVPAPTKSSAAKIKIAIKATKEKHTVKINKDSTVKELKNEAAKAFKMPVEKVCLIYSGKVLKDSDVLSAISIEDGHILHLIVKTNVVCFQ